MDKLAIHGKRKMVKYQVETSVEAVESTAARYPIGKVPGVGGSGGGQQLILPTGWQKFVKSIP